VSEISFQIFRSERVKKLIEATEGAGVSAHLYPEELQWYTEAVQEIFEWREPRFGRRLMQLHVDSVAVGPHGYPISVRYKPMGETPTEWPRPLWYLLPPFLKHEEYVIYTHEHRSGEVVRQTEVKELHERAERGEIDLLVDATHVRPNRWRLRIAGGPPAELGGTRKQMLAFLMKRPEEYFALEALRADRNVGEGTCDTSNIINAYTDVRSAMKKAGIEPILVSGGAAIRGPYAFAPTSSSTYALIIPHR